MLKIYKSGHGQFYFAKCDGDWWSLCSNASDIGTYRLCESCFGYEEEKDAWKKAIEVSCVDEVYFDRIAREDSNYVKIREFIQRFFRISDEEAAESFGYHPEIVELAYQVVGESELKANVDSYVFNQIYNKVKYLYSVWSGDGDRVKAYARKRDMVREYVFRDHVIIDVRCRDHHKRDLLRDFHNCWNDKRLKGVIREACKKYPEEDDFDKRYAYVKDKIKKKQVKEKQMKVRFKRLEENAVLPAYANDGEDVGLDMVAVRKEYDEDGNVVYGTGVAVEIPKGYGGFLFPRSSNSKKELLLSNSVGVVDPGYRGEVIFKFKKTFEPSILTGMWHSIDKEYEVGDKVGQMVILPYPHIEPEWAEELSSSVRGEGGFGSTGK